MMADLAEIGLRELLAEWRRQVAAINSIQRLKVVRLSVLIDPKGHISVATDFESAKS